MVISVLLWLGTYSGSYTGTQVKNVNPSGLSLSGVLDSYSDSTPVASEEFHPGGIRGNQGVNREELDVR